jgi:hypothetical protein
VNCLPSSSHRDAERGDVKDVMALDPPTNDAADGDASALADGVNAPGTLRAVRNVIQESTIWKTLNYGMNYDIHKVHIIFIIVIILLLIWISTLLLLFISL